MNLYSAENFRKESSDKWDIILNFAFENADEVEFNIFYKNKELKKILEEFSEHIIKIGPSYKEKIYSSGSVIRLQISDSIQSYIKSKSYSDWLHSPLEDISFLKDGNEFLATITHEGYVIAKLSEEKRKFFKGKGIDFWCEWN